MTYDNAPLKLHGLTVPLTPSDVSEVIWTALEKGTYEAKEAVWAVKAVKPNDRVLELGSGMGIITSLLAQIDGVTVMAFEANPDTLRLAERVVHANNVSNVTLAHGLLTAGPPRNFRFYRRNDLWMSSLIEEQGPYRDTIDLTSLNIDEFIEAADIDIVVMDIEGAEKELLSQAELPGVERVFLEFHDHLYGLAGIKQIMRSMADKGFAYDPRGSSGPCVLFSRNDDPREYEEDEVHAYQ